MLTNFAPTSPLALFVFVVVLEARLLKAYGVTDSTEVRIDHWTRQEWFQAHGTAQLEDLCEHGHDGPVTRFGLTSSAFAMVAKGYADPEVAANYVFDRLGLIDSPGYDCGS